MAVRMDGKGVTQAVDNVNDVLADELLGFDVFDQRAIDQAMIDSTARATKARLEQTPSSASPWPQPTPQRNAQGSPCTGTSVG